MVCQARVVKFRERESTIKDMNEPEVSAVRRENYLISLGDQVKKAEKALIEAGNVVELLKGETQMETAFREGIRLFRENGNKRVNVQFGEKNAQLKMLDVVSGSFFDKTDNIRFIVSDTDEFETYLADVSLQRSPGKLWTAHEVPDVHLDSNRGGHGSQRFILASGLKDATGQMHNGGLSDRLLAVIDTVKSLANKSAMV